MPAEVPLHFKARSQGNRDYPQRVHIADEQVAWAIPLSAYQPVTFTHAAVLEQNCEVKPGGWADPPVPQQAVIEARGSHELQARQLQWQYDGKGRPLNPRGRTGMCERGCLGKWGPNHAGDAIVTRHRRRDPGEPTPPGASSIVLEMVAIKRRDTGEWAIPGGMADPSEVGKAALMREFREEAAASPEGAAAFDALLHELFADSNGRVVYRGYVDDPRNTDNAWMETIAMHFHCPRRLGDILPLNAGDDAAAVMWLEVGDHNPLYRKLYASHKQIMDLIYATHGGAAGLERASRRESQLALPRASCTHSAAALWGPIRHQVQLWGAWAGCGEVDASAAHLTVADLLDIFSICTVAHAGRPPHEPPHEPPRVP